MIQISAIEALFLQASANGFKKPKLRASNFTFTLAPAHGKNPGAVYINDSLGNYIGKIKNDVMYLLGGYGHVVAELQEVKDNPAAEAVKYGHQTGQCSICSRRLDNATSIYNGIGPICAEKMGIPLQEIPKPDKSML